MDVTDATQQLNQARQRESAARLVLESALGDLVRQIIATGPWDNSIDIDDATFLVDHVTWSAGPGGIDPVGALALIRDDEILVDVRPPASPDAREDRFAPMPDEGTEPDWRYVLATDIERAEFVLEAHALLSAIVADANCRADASEELASRVKALIG